jgi:curved DNA-binding protein
MEFKDYYKILGVARDAPLAEIKRAYRKLAQKHHPDINKGSGTEARFKEIAEAYEVLKAPEKRAAYDALGTDFKAGQEFRPPPGWDAGFERSGAFSGGEAADSSDFFESLFGRSRGTRQGNREGFHARGVDHHAKVLIDLDDAYRGATRTITLRVAELGEDGRVHMRERKLDVRIPKGVRQGQHIRLSGQGGPGIGKGPAGDLYLEVEYAPHPLFRAEGKDVYLDLPVAPWEAALGKKVRAPTPAGAVDIQVPAGAAAGTKLRLKARGIPSEPPGDFYVVVQIALPPADTDEARRLYHEMEEKLAFNPRTKFGV